MFDDTGLEKLIPAATMAATAFAGQFCMTGSPCWCRAEYWMRYARMVGALGSLVIGPASDPASRMGPMIDKANVERVERMIQAASTYGRIVVRGGPIKEGPLANGEFFRPALVEVDDPNLPVVREEVFSPVVTLEPFDTEAEAIRLAKKN